MLTHRLIILFSLFVVGFFVVGLRLFHLQVNEVDEWREKMRGYVHHQDKIETARGRIVDRNGVVLAFDDPCYDLAIDYRAMNLDDRWLGALAGQKLKGESLSKKERSLRVKEIKAALAAKVEAIPGALAKICDTSSLSEPTPESAPYEKILARFEEIRQTISILRQDHWSRSYDADRDKMMAAAGESLDEAAYNEPLKEERIAHTILPHISDEAAFYFRQHAEDFPGIVVVDSHTRTYPFKTVGCHVLGTLRGVDAATLKDAKNRFELPNLLSDNDPGNPAGYLPGDRMGEMGIEKLAEKELRGTRGVRLFETQAKGETAPASTEPAAGGGGEAAERKIDPVAGREVRTTLDISLQQDIEAVIKDPRNGLLKGKDGKDHFVAMVVMSVAPGPHDGEVLAMISTPAYDPNKIDDTRVQLNRAQWDRPLANRALERYRPGSTVKPLVAAAALTVGAITPETSVNCVGYLFPNRPDIFRCAEVHGQVSLVPAIAESCNIYFYNVGDKMGVTNLVTWFHYYGFGQDTGFELPDTPGLVYKLTDERSRDTETMRTVARMMGIGEGDIDVSPLQLADGYATLLHGGRHVVPRILADTPVKESQAFTVSPATLAVVKEGMRKTVTMGTGKTTFKNFNLPVAGKTGTADVSNKPVFDEAGNRLYDMDRPLKNRDGTPKLGPDKQPMYEPVWDKGTHSWFVGYAPAENPKFVVVAVKEFGGFGSTFAAPLVKEAFLELERHNYLPAMDVVP